MAKEKGLTIWKLGAVFYVTFSFQNLRKDPFHIVFFFIDADPCYSSNCCKCVVTPIARLHIACLL